VSKENISLMWIDLVIRFCGIMLSMVTENLHTFRYLASVNRL
jgi:hypothetical protein